MKFGKKPQNLWNLLISFSIFRASAAALLFWTIVSACSPSVTSMDQLNQGLNWTSAVVEGGNPTAMPKRTLEAPVVVLILDANKAPVRDASIEAVLVDLDPTENIEQALAADVLQKKWELKLTQSVAAKAASGGASANSTQASDDDEKLGRIEKLDARTDSAGKARIWLRASTLFNKTVRLIVRAGQSGVFGASYASTVIKTNDYKSGAKISIKTDNDRKEKAGVPFEMSIVILDNETGAALKNFEGTHTINIDATPSSSWAGIAPSFPKGEINCKFTGGQCILPRSPFTLVKPEELSVKVSFKEGVVPTLENEKILVTPNGEKHSLVLKNHAGALRDDSLRILAISKPAGEETSLTAAWIDAAGNYIDDASNVVWSIDNAQLLIGTNFSGNPTTVNFKPLKTGIGYLELSAEGKKTLNPVKLTIPSGPFIKWGVRINNLDNSPTMTAGSCVTVDVFAADALMNANSEVNFNAIPLRLEIQNGDLQPYVAKRAHFEGAGAGQYIRTLPVKITNGEASGVEKVCLFDAKTTINPKVIVSTATGATPDPKYPSLLSFTGLSDRITVNKGIAERLGLVFNDGSEKHVCWTYDSTKYLDKDDPCIADEFFQSGSPSYLELKPVLFDAAGNVVGAPQSNWQQFHNSGVVAQGSTNPSFAVTAGSSFGTTVSTTTNVPADGNFRLSLINIVDGGVLNTLKGSLVSGQFPTITLASARTVEYSFFISARVPHHAEVIPCVGTTCDPRPTSVLSTDRFGVRLRYMDSSNNPIYAFVARPANEYPRKKLYHIDKPVGELAIRLQIPDAGQERKPIGATAQDCNGVPVTDTLCLTNRPPRQGLTSVGTYTPSLVDFEVPLSSTTPADNDGSFRIKPETALGNERFFQSFKAINNQQIAGSITNLVVGSYPAVTIPVSSPVFVVQPGDPKTFKIVDPSNGNSPYADGYVSNKIAIQQLPFTTSGSLHLAKSVVIWPIDLYGNVTQMAAPATFEWTENASNPDECIDGNTPAEANVRAPLLRINEGTTTPKIRSLTGTGHGVITTPSAKITLVTPSVEEGYRVYLHTPCAREGTLRVIPTGATYDPTFSTFLSGSKSKLPPVEFVGDVADHFFVQTLDITGTDHRTRTTVHNSVSGVESGTYFYMRLIPMVQNNTNHVNSYEGIKELRLTGVNNSSWAGTTGNVLPPDTAAGGQIYFCNFKKESMLTVYSNTPIARNDIPVCLIRGPQRLVPTCDGTEEAVQTVDNSNNVIDLLLGGNRVCEKTSGFRMVSKTPGSDNKIILIKDETASTTVQHDGTYPYNSAKLTINPGPPTQLVLANRCGGPLQNSVTWNLNQPNLNRTLKIVDEYTDSNVSPGKYYHVTADDIVDIVVAKTDSFGNWVGDHDFGASGGLAVTANTATNAAYLSESATPPSIVRNSEPASGSCAAHTRFRLTPTTAATQNALNLLGTPSSKDKFDTLTFTATVGTVASPVTAISAVTIAVRPGRPASVAVETPRVNLANNNFDTQTHSNNDAFSLSPADCARIVVRARDSDQNIIYDNAGAVQVNIKAKNYYTPPASGSLKHLFQPGGLYFRNGSELKLTPVTSSTLGWNPHPSAASFTTGSGTGSNAGGLAIYAASDSYEAASSSNYAGHESIAGQVFLDGKLANLNRYFCVFDETATPSVHVTLIGNTGSTPFSIEGESPAMNIVSLPTSLIGVRNVTGERLCPLPNGTGSGILLPRRIKTGSSFIYSLDSDGTPAQCKTIGVSTTPVGFKWILTDAVGNLKTDYTLPPAPASTSGSYSVQTTGCPSGSQWCVVTYGRSALETTGSIGLDLTANNGSNTISTSRILSVLSKEPRTIKIFRAGDADSSTSAIVSADNKFDLAFQAKDAFGNFINDPEFGNDYRMILAMTYSSTSGSTNYTGVDTAHARDSSGLEISGGTGEAPPVQLTPMIFTLTGSGKWQTQTQAGSGLFHFKNNKNGSVHVSVTATFRKNGVADYVSAPVTFDVAVATGAVSKTIVSQLDTDNEISKTTPNDIEARSITLPYLFSTASYDQYLNPFVAINPSENTVTPSCSNPAAVTCLQAGIPGVIQIQTIATGTFNLSATRGSVRAPSSNTAEFYPFTVSAGAPSAVRLVPAGANNGFNLNTGSIAAGDTFEFRLEFTDNFNNIVTSLNGGTWALTWSVGDTYPDIPLGGQKITLPSNPACTVSSGVCTGTYTATFRGASPNRNNSQLRVTATRASPALTLAGALGIQVNPTALSKFSVKKTSTGNPIAGRKDETSSKFNVQVSAHDAIGNHVALSSAQTFRLNIVRPDGSKTYFPDSSVADASRAGNGLIRWSGSGTSSAVSNTYDPISGADTGGSATRNAATDYTLAAGSYQTDVNNLAFDDPGDYKIIATAGVITTPLAQSETITFTPSLASLKDFYLDLPANLTLVAGQTSTIRVVARTFYNSALRGLDALLSNNVSGSPYGFTWSTLANNTQFTGQSLTGNIPSSGATLPTTFTFIDGSALVPVRFDTVDATSPATVNPLLSSGVKKLAIRGSDGTTHHFSSLPATTPVVTLTPAALHTYSVSVNGLSSTLSDIKAALDSRFSITVQALDQFSNRRAGETGLDLVAEKSADVNLVGSGSTTTILRKPSGASNIFTVGFEPPATFNHQNIDLSTGYWTQTGLVYLVPQTVKFTLNGAQVTVNSTNNNSTSGGYIQFNPALGSVRDYKVEITETADVTNTGQLRTHGNTAVRVTARDIAGNPVPNIGTSLNGQTYTWAGANTLSITSEAPVYNGLTANTAAFTAAGEWITFINFKTTQSFLANALTVTDNYSVAAGADPRTGGNVAPFTVYSRHKDYTLDALGATVDWNVGTSAQLKITARGYDNLPVQQFDTRLNAFQYTWDAGQSSGTGTGLGNAPIGTQTLFDGSPTKTNTSITSFSNGVAFVNITPYKKETISGTAVRITDNASPNKTGNLISTINVRAGTVSRYVVTTNQTTRNADNDATNGLFDLYIQPTDMYQNPTVGEAGLAITTNGGTGSKTHTTLKNIGSVNTQSLDLTSGLDASSGIKTYTGMYYPVPNSAITFGLNNTAATVVPSSAMTFNLTEKSIVGYAMTVAATQTAGTAFNVTLTPKDIAGNTIDGSTQITDAATRTALATALNARLFILSGPNLAPNGAAATATASNTAISNTKNLAASFNASTLLGTMSNIILKKKETIPANAFVLEDDFTTPRFARNTAAITVNAAAPASLVADELPAVRAGTQFDVRAYLKDTYGNTSVTDCASGTAGTYADIGWRSSGGSFSYASGDATPGGAFTTTTGKAPEIKAPDGTTNVTSGARVTPNPAQGDEMKLRITLYKKGDNQVRLNACGLTPITRDVSVNETNTAQLVRITTSATRPTTNLPVSDVECLHSGADLASAGVICPTIYSYFWDTYGNTFGDGTAQCTWSGARAYSSDTTTLPTISGSSVNLQVTNTGPINTTLTCNGPNSTTANLLLYGGVSFWRATVCQNSTCTSPSPLTIDSTPSGDMTGRSLAAGTPMVLKNIVTEMWKGTGTSRLAYNTAAPTAHQITIDKSNFTAANSSGVSSIPASVTANLLTTGQTATADTFNFNFTAPYSTRTLGLTLRGRAINVTNMTVQGGAASTIAFASGSSTNILPTAGTAITETIDVRDTAANFAECTSLIVSVQGSTPRNAVGTGTNIPGGSGTDFTYNSPVTLTNVSGSPGRFQVPLTFYKAESITMQFTTAASCGATISLTQTYTVQPNNISNMYARLSTDGTTPPTAHQEEISCAMGAGLIINCPTLYLHVWDFYGNYVANQTCNDTGNWSWASYDNGNNGGTAGSNGSSESFTPVGGAVRSQTITISSPDVNKGFLDGKLTCARANTQVHKNLAAGSEVSDSSGTAIRTVVTGGLKKLEMTLQQKDDSGSLIAATSPIATVKAAADNVRITQIVAKKRKLNVDVVKSDFVSSSTEPIAFSTAPVTAGSDTTENNRTFTSGTTPLRSSATLDCSFDTNGICKIPSTSTTAMVDMTFAIVESVQRKVILNLRGKTSEFIVTAVTPAAPASVNFQAGRLAANSTPMAGTAISEPLQVRDQFGNISACEQLTVSAHPSAGNHDSPGSAAGNDIPGSANTFDYNNAVSRNSSGSGFTRNFSVPITFYKAESITMRYAVDATGTNCAGGAGSIDHTYTVAAKTGTGSGMLGRLSTVSDTPPTTHTEEIMCSLGAGLAMNCPTVYLHTWDAYGNYLANTTCDSWSWNNYDGALNVNGVSEDPTPSTPLANASRSQSLTVPTPTTAKGYLDGRLSCNRADTTVARTGANLDTDNANNSKIHTIVYGGIKRIKVAAKRVEPSVLDVALGPAITVTGVKAAANNVQLTQLQTFMRKVGGEIAKSNFVAGQDETINVSTSGGGDAARTLTGGTHPISTTTTLACRFDNATGICRNTNNTADQTMDLNFKIVESAARVVTFDLRGKTATATVQPVTPAAPASVEFVTGASANSTPKAGQAVSENLLLKDAFGNKSTCQGLAATKESAGSADGLGNNGTIPGTGTAFTIPTATVSNSGTGSLVYKNFAVPLTFYRAGTHTMRFAVNSAATDCAGGAGSIDQTYTVSPKDDTGMLARLSTDADTAPTTHTEEIKCPLGAGLAMNCPTVYLHTWDAYGNYISNTTCSSWTFAHYDGITGATGVSEAPTPSTAWATASRSQTLTAAGTASGFMDGRLVCNRANTAIQRAGTTSVDTTNTTPIQTVVYGGLKGIQISATKEGTNYASAAAITIPTVKAAANNVQLTQLKAMVRRFGADVAKSDFVAGQSETINVSTTSAGVTAEQNRTLSSGTHPISTSSTLACEFDNTDGICKVAAGGATKTMNLNFKIVESAARDVTFNMRGKTATATVTAVTPANAASVAVDVKQSATSVTTLGVRTAFNIEATVSDAFGNRTTLKQADGTTCAVGNATASLNHTAPAATATSLGNAASITPSAYNGGGVYTFNVTNTAVTLAGTKTVSVDACGAPTANSATLTFNPGALNQVKLRNSAAITTTVNAATTAITTDLNLAEDRCGLQTSGSGANCPTISAFFFDQDNNTVAGQTCNWTYTNNTTAATNYGALLTAPTLSSTSGTTSSTVTHSDFLDGKLRCTAASNSSIFNETALYGGIAKVDLAWVAKGRNTSNGTETSTNNGTTVTAGDANLQFASTTSIKLMGPVKGNDTLVPNAGTNLPVTFTTTAPNNGASSPLPTNAANCDFTAGGGICNNQSYNFNFKTSNVGGTPYQATVSVRGKTATMTGITVQPANADNVTLTAKISGTETVVNSVTTDQQFDIYANIKDLYGNFTDLDTSYITCAAPTAASVVTTGISVNTSKRTDNTTNRDAVLVATSRVPDKIASTAGQYRYNLFKLVDIQANGNSANSTLKFDLCGIPNTATGNSITLTVNPGVPKEVFLSATIGATRTPMADKVCDLNNSGAGANCDTIYTIFYDAQQNLITSANGGTCTTWSAANIPTGSPAGLTTPNISTAASSSQTFTSTGAFSLTLTCNNTTAGFTTTTNSVKLRGGIAALELDWDAKTLDASNTAVTTNKGTTVHAQPENLIIKTVKFKTYDFNTTPTLVDLAQGLASEDVQITTNASNGPSGVNPVILGVGSTRGAATCNMSNDGTCTTSSEISHNVHKLTLNKADETGRSVTVSIRAVTASITGLTVNSGAMVAANRINTTFPTTATVDIPVTSGAIELRDQYLNPTMTNCSTMTFAYEYSSNGGTTYNTATIGSTGNSRAPDGTDPTFVGTGTALAASAAITGRFELPTATASALKFVKDGSYRLTPTVCGANLATQTIVVSKGAVTKVKLFASTPTDPFTAAEDTGPIHCPHTTATSTSANVSCPTINAYFFDVRGNRVTDSSANCTSWNFVKDTNSSDSATLAGLTASTASTSPTASDWIDGTLRCEKGGAAGSDLAPQLTLYGGTHSVTAAYSATSPTAGNDNVTLNNVTIRQRKLGSTVVAAVARTNEKIVVTHNATQAGSGSPHAILTNNFTTDGSEKSFQCDSAATTGVCTPATAPVISLTKVETPTITLNLRGKLVNTNFTVSAGAVTNATLTLGTASPWTAGSTYTASFLPKDAFGNPTQSGCTTLTGSGAISSPSSVAPAYGTVGAWDANNGYPISTIILRSATSQTLTYSCNPSTTVTAAQNITVDTAATNKISITSDGTKPTYTNSLVNQDVKCTLSSGTNSNTGLTCPTLYAWGYDDFGNSTASANDVCQWQRSNYTGAAFGTAVDVDGNATTAGLTSAVLNATGELNARLSCSGKTMLNQNNIYGGVAKITLAVGQAVTSSGTNPTTYTTSATNIKAAPDNVIITQINAFSKRENIDVIVPLVSGSNTLTMAATVTGVEDTAANGTSYNLASSQLTCAFDTTTSQCSSPLSFTFKKVHASTPSTRPQITLDLKSKTSVISVSPITAGNGATLSLTGWNNTITIGASNISGVTMQVKDMYNNNSALDPSGGNCAGSAVLTGFQAGVFSSGTYANSLTTPTTTAGTGSYSISGSIYKAATHTVTLSACGLSRTETVQAVAGTFERALITTSTTAPASYTCTSDLCEETLPTCTAANTAACGPFYVWKYDVGANPLFTGNTYGDCGTTMNGITVTNATDATAATASATGKTTTTFNVTAGTAGKHIAGTIQCTAGGINKGNRLIFKAPTKLTPQFKCYPWGIDSTGAPEALCVVTNETGYTIADVGVTACTSTTTGATRCSSYSSTNDAIGNYTVSNHCFNLPTKEASGATRFAGHRCSVVISGVDAKTTPPFWIEAASPDVNKVVFDSPPQVRIPIAYNFTTTFASATSTCAASTNYHSSQAAGCSSTHADTIVANSNSLVFDGITATACVPGGTSYPIRSQTIQTQANANLAKLANPAAALLDSTNDFVDSINTDSCSGVDLALNGTCTVKLYITRPYNETVLKITDTSATPKIYYIRTGESPRCTNSTNTRDL
ncbi:MAG: hypothetical protein EBR09_03695 [Proteobacteria bacterium]|nr:hypothetical protein [Pseudomonadota bacterium]